MNDKFDDFFNSGEEIDLDIVEIGLFELFINECLKSPDISDTFKIFFESFRFVVLVKLLIICFFSLKIAKFLLFLYETSCLEYMSS